MIAGFFFLIATIIAKCPGSSGLAHEVANFICFSWTKSNNPAKLMMLVP